MSFHAVFIAGDGMAIFFFLAYQYFALNSIYILPLKSTLLHTALTQYIGALSQYAARWVVKYLATAYCNICLVSFLLVCCVSVEYASEVLYLHEALWHDPSHALLVGFQRLDIPL